MVVLRVVVWVVTPPWLRNTLAWALTEWWWPGCAAPTYSTIAVLLLLLVLVLLLRCAAVV